MDIKIYNKRLQKGLWDLKIHILRRKKYEHCNIFKTCFQYGNVLNTKEKYNEH